MVWLEAAVAAAGPVASALAVAKAARLELREQVPGCCDFCCKLF